MGIALNHELGCRPWRVSVAPAERHAMDQAEKLRYGATEQNAAWSWGHGPLVILVHGWGGRGSQLAPLGLYLAGLGFRAVAIDVTGHGASARYATGWSHFFNDLAALAASQNEPVHAYVGHSVGGLAMMAARQVSGIRASRYVCICSPSYPSSRIELMQRRIAPSEDGMARYKAFLAQQFAAPSWQALEAGAAYAGAGPETLLIYDKRDRLVSDREGDKIHALCPQTQLVKLHARGHSRILLDAQLMQATAGFLQQPVRTRHRPPRRSHAYAFG